MGIFDEFKRLAHPCEDEEDDGFYNDYEEQEAPERPEYTERRERRAERPERSERRERRSESMDNVSSFSGSERRSSNVVNIRANTQLQVVVVKPEKYEEAAAIADHLRERRTVVLNLEKAPKDVARRLLDFMSGVAYAIEGRIKPVAISTYLITPFNVDIMGEDLMDTLGSNGVHFR